MKPTIITAATVEELTSLIRSTGAERESRMAYQETYRGKVGTSTVILCATGMGKVNTASAVTALLERYESKLLINTGCAGAYRGSGLGVGDLALASAEVYGDEGVITPSGWEPLDCIGIPLLDRKGNRYFNEFPLSFSASEKALRLATALGLPIKRGRFVTVSTCSGTAARGEALFERFGAVCENMEGAAAAHVSLVYGVDCLEIRGISNLVEDRDLARWNIPLAVEGVQKFVLKYLEGF